MRSAPTPIKSLIAATCALALAATALVLAPGQLGASAHPALTHVQTITSFPDVGRVHDLDMGGSGLAIADTDNDRVVIAGQSIGGVVGSGAGQFDDPRGIAWGDGVVYVSDSGNSRIQSFVFAATPTPGWVYDDEWTLPQFADPRGLDVAASGLVYVADNAFGTVYAIDPAGGVTTFATGLSGPLGVAVSGAEILVTDTGNGAIRRYAAAGGLNGSITGLNEPADLAVDTDGNIFVTQLSDNIVAFDSAGTELFTFGSGGNAVDQFADPRGISIADDRNLYVADSGNKRIEQYRHAAQVAFAPASTTSTVIEDAGTLDLTVELSDTADAPVTIDVVVAEGTTASSGTDFTLPETIVVPADTLSTTLTVTLVDDGDGSEEDEQLVIELSDPRFAVLDTSTTATITITDDDIVANEDHWADRVDENPEDLSLVTNRDDQLAVVAAQGLLANDVDRSDADVDDTVNTIAGNSIPSSGTVGVDQDGGFVYTPAPGFVGEVTFTYTVSDGSASETADVALRVNGPVTAAADSYTIAEDGAINTAEDLFTDSVLANDDDGETFFEDTLTVTAWTEPSHGALSATTGTGHFVYVPAEDFNGTDSFGYTVTDHMGSTVDGTVTITVTEVNDVPDFTVNPHSVQEDAPAQTVEGFVSDLDNGGGTDEDGQTIAWSLVEDEFGDNSDAPELFSVQPAIDAAGTLTYTPAPNKHGVATLQVTGTDNGTTDGEADPQATTKSVTVTIGDVNDPPTVVVSDQTILEDAGSVSFPTTTWAEQLHGTDPELESEGLRFGLGTVVQDATNPVVFSEAPAIDAETGAVTFQVANGDHGAFTLPITVTDDYGTPDPLDDESTDVDLAVTVTAVNDAPVVVTQTIEISEDPFPAEQSHAVTAWAESVSDGDEGTQTVTYNFVRWENSVGQPVAFATGGAPSVAADGTLTFTLEANENGVFTVVVTASDDGGVANDGVDTSGELSFNVAVNSVNDAPIFAVNDQSIGEDEDPLSQTVAEAGWLQPGYSDGDPTTGPDDDQNLTFAVTGVTVAGDEVANLFSQAPTIDELLNLVYTPVADAHGVATVTITATDDNATPADPNDDESTHHDLTITINAVNDAPTFTIADDDTVEDEPAQTVAITGVTPGPANESDQVLSWTVTDVDGVFADLFETAPHVNTDGQLAYTPATDANGDATVTLTLTDDNATPEDATDDVATSDTITISIAAVNDAPTVEIADQTIDEDAGAQSLAPAGPGTNWASTAPSGTDPELTETLTYALGTVSAFDFAVDAAPAIDETTGVLTFETALHANGSFTVDIDVTDDNATPADALDDETTTSTLTVTVTPVNDAPTVSVVGEGTVSIDEDAGAQTFSADGTGTSWTDAASNGTDPELTEALSYEVASVSAFDFATDAAPAIDPVTGALTFTTAEDANGAFTIAIDVTDDNGTTGEGETTDDVTTRVELDVDVVSLNDAPELTPTAQTVDEDAGATTLLRSAWAPDLTDGDPEAGAVQTLSYALDPTTPWSQGTTPVAFAVEAEPTINAAGDISFTAADDENGDFIVNIVITDDGSTALEGDENTTTVALPVTIAPTNDANDVPSFATSNQSHNEDAGAISIAQASWASEVDDGDDWTSTGPGDAETAYDAQGLTFTVENNTAPGLFSVQPEIGPNNSLDYTLATHANNGLDGGPATLTVRLTDDAGTPDDTDDDLFAERTLTISVTAIDDPEVAIDDVYILDVDTDAGDDPDVDLTVGGDDSLLANDIEADVDDDELTVSGNSIPDFGLVQIQLDGSFTYDAEPGFIGDATFTYTMTDGNGGFAPATGSVLMKVNGPPTLIEGADLDYQTNEGTDLVFTLEQIAALFEDVDTLDDVVSFSSAGAPGVGEGSVTVPEGEGAEQVLSYSPAAGFTGTASFDVTVSDGRLESTTTLSVDVNAAPDAGDDAAEVLEDGSVDITLATLMANDTDDADNVVDTVTFVEVGQGTHGAVTIVGDVVTYTPEADYAGADSFTYTVTDGELQSTATVGVTVTPVNDAPEFNIGSVDARFEDGEPVTVAGFYTGEFHGGGADEAEQVLTLSVTNDNSGLFTAEPAIDGEGALTFTSAPDANGSAVVTVTLSDGGPTTDGGVNELTEQFTIVITDLNDAPTATLGADESVPEDAGAQTVADFLTNVHPGGGADEEAGQTVTWTVVNDNPELFSAAPAIDAAGTLTYTPAEHANGHAMVTVTLTDNGANGDGHVNSTALFFDIDVDAVNDAPVFTLQGDLEVDEDSGTQTVTGFVVSSGVGGGADEANAQSILWSVTNTRNDLFVDQPTLDVDGNLSFSTAEHANGVATVTIEAVDNGGTLNGGLYRTVETFTLTITALDDAPTAVLGADQAVDEDAGAQTVAGFLTAADPGGGSDEADQIVTWSVATDNPALFEVPPAIDTDGVLTYEPAADANGNATVTVTVADTGQTGAGHFNSTDLTFGIAIAPVNDAPVFVLGDDVVVDEDSGAVVVGGFYSGEDEGGAADEDAQDVVVEVTSDGESLFDTPPSIDEAGNLNFIVAANANGSAQVTVTATDTGGVENGGQNVTGATFTITVNAVNDAPTFVLASAEVVFEDGEAAAVEGFLTEISPGGGADESGQVPAMTIANDNPGLFTTQPAIDEAGTLVFETAENANGFATVTVTVNDGGGVEFGGTEESTETFTIEITPLNDAPTAVVAGDLAVDEDAAMQTVASFLTEVDPGGGADEATQTVTWTVTNDNAGLFSLQPTIDATGRLTYTPAPDANGTATVTVTLADSGEQGPGHEHSTDLVFSIVVESVNDQPSFQAGGDVTVEENSGATTVPGWASVITTGPADEIGQARSFELTVSTPGLFSQQPALSPTGDLLFTLAPQQFGTANVAVSLVDGGGTARGGENRFPTAPATINFSIVVVEVPDPVLCRGLEATIVGTDGPDALDGTNAPDVIAGLGGNDVIRGFDGDDVICGGDGDDRIYAGGGNDLVEGGSGGDHIFGGDGRDRLIGNDGRDVFRGGGANDQVIGGEGRDVVYGGSGADRIFGDTERDRINGGAGRDRCDGGPALDSATKCEAVISVP